MFKFILKGGRDMLETHVEDLTRKQITLIANCYALVKFKKLCAPLKALFCEDRVVKGITSNQDLPLSCYSGWRI